MNLIFFIINAGVIVACILYLLLKKPKCFAFFTHVTVVFI